jgi:hypothetical protein
MMQRPDDEWGQNLERRVSRSERFPRPVSLYVPKYQPESTIPVPKWACGSPVKWAGVFMAGALPAFRDCVAAWIAMASGSAGASRTAVLGDIVLPTVESARDLGQEPVGWGASRSSNKRGEGVRAASPSPRGVGSRAFLSNRASS